MKEKECMKHIHHPYDPVEFSYNNKYKVLSANIMKAVSESV